MTWTAERRVLRVLAWISVAAGLMMLGSGCGDEATQRAETSSKRPTATGADPSAQASRGQGRSLPDEPGPLIPGRYTVDLFNSELSLTLGAGWQGLQAPSPEFTSILHADGSLIALVRVTRVVDPRARPGTNKQAAAQALQPPSNLNAWLEHHPRLRSTRRPAATIAGRRAERVDVTPVRGYRGPDCPVRCVALLVSSDAIAALHEGRWVRSYRFASLGRDFLVGVDAPAARFARAVTRAERILRTARFDER